ncbi:hypothetical protein BAT02nite_15600 [Bacillus atrophaeus]|nr:hypothetical protein BAT02nite_15600 [Bacillus atrophaeus]
MAGYEKKLNPWVLLKVKMFYKRLDNSEVVYNVAHYIREKRRIDKADQTCFIYPFLYYIWPHLLLH